MNKPTEYPRFASQVDGTPSPEIVPPDDPKKDSGWVGGEKPPSQYFNWMHHLYYTWIAWLDGAVTTNEGAITALDGRVTTNEGAITALDGRVTTNEGAITALDGRVTVNETDIQSNAQDISDLENEVANLNPVGSLLDFAGDTPPNGWLLCDGALYDSVTNPEYANLFAVIGTHWGGTGADAFNVPNSIGRVTLGVGTYSEDVGDGSKDYVYALADSGGEAKHILVTDELASHSHGYDSNSNGTTCSAAEGEAGGTLCQTHTTGGDLSHENRMPYNAALKIIKY